MATPLSTAEIAGELAAYGVELPQHGLQQLSTYLELLLRWNRRVNLTGLREPRQIVRRLFGESLYVAQILELKGWLVDIGSGAGFPGLALKLAVPDLRVTLVEARHKKCAFLKEVVRACGFNYADVVAARFEDWASTLVPQGRAVFITTRAVSVEREMLNSMERLLAVPGGKGVFLTTAEGSKEIKAVAGGWQWQDPIIIPGASRSLVFVGSPSVSIM